MVEHASTEGRQLPGDSGIQKIVNRVNPDLTRRREDRVETCRVFESPYTALEPDMTCRFSIDREAKRLLPDLVGNTVQIVRDKDGVDDQQHRNYTKQRNIGIVFSGGPAPGGHNVIAGLYDSAKKANPASKIYGFLLGPDGVIENEAVELTDRMINSHRNLGGFGMIKTGRTKIESPRQMALSRETCKDLELDALVIVGGDDSNTNAAFLAQELYGENIQVIGVPKTIDGDIQVRDELGQVLCAISFGFHTAARSFSQNISQLCTDASSDVKYWHICKVMGRVASHLALEAGLQTHANIVLIGEDLADYVDRRRLEKADKEGTQDYTAYGMTLRHLSRVICNAIAQRAAQGKSYGVMVIPEGILEFINEIQVFIIKLNTIIGEYNKTHDTDFHADFATLEDKLDYLRNLRRIARRAGEEERFAVWNARDDDLFQDLPAFFKEGLLTERDTHGNFQFSLVETEKVLLDLVSDYLDVLRENGDYKVGIRRNYCIKTLEKGQVDPDIYGPVLFSNYDDGAYLLIQPDVISKRTLKQVLVRHRLISDSEPVPDCVQKLFDKSVPKFKTQTHFYGYDGRGGDPTRFDCVYGYNLGLTAFSLIGNGATGQMAAIRYLEEEFDRWEPIGIPIAPMMQLEDRKGKLALVLAKSLVDLESMAFKTAKSYRRDWLAAVPGADRYRQPGPVRFSDSVDEDKPMTLMLNALDNPQQ